MALLMTVRLTSIDRLLVQEDLLHVVGLYSCSFVNMGFLLNRKLENFHRDDAARICLIAHAL